MGMHKTRYHCRWQMLRFSLWDGCTVTCDVKSLHFARCLKKKVSPCVAQYIGTGKVLCWAAIQKYQLLLISVLYGWQSFNKSCVSLHATERPFVSMMQLFSTIFSLQAPECWRAKQLLVSIVRSRTRAMAAILQILVLPTFHSMLTEQMHGVKYDIILLTSLKVRINLF